MEVVLAQGEVLEIKTFQDYIVWTRKLWSNIGNGKTHAVLGIISEIGEIADCYKKEFYGKKIDTINLKEEIGDLCYYIARLIDENEHNISTTSKPNALIFDETYVDIYGRKLSGLLYGLHDIHSLVSNTIFTYGSAIHLLEILIGLMNYLGLDVLQVLEANIRKLETRYNKGQFDANARDNVDREKEKGAING